MILATASPAGVVLTFAAAVAYAIPAIAARQLNEPTARGALVAGWLLHGLVLVFGFLGDDPRFGFAQAISATVWFVVTVFVVESHVFPQITARWTVALLALAVLTLPLLFPGEPLRGAGGNPLAPLHWTLGLGAYGLFAAAVVHAWLMRRAETVIRQGGEPYTGVPLLTLERLTFKFATGGFLLLSATIVAGFLFTRWRWNHENIFSLLAWAAFAMLLLGRMRFGWRGRKAVRVLYTGSILLLLAYVGSRFVFEVILGKST